LKNESSVVDKKFENASSSTIPTGGTVFNPQSMKCVIEAWLKLRHPLERKCLKAVLHDIFNVLSFSQGLLYALVDAWLVCVLPHQLIEIESYPDFSSAAFKEFIHYNAETYHQIQTLLLEYQTEVFSSPIKKMKRDKSRSRLL
jgi:hypothetical protein